MTARDHDPTAAAGAPAAASAGQLFVVKLRNAETRMWGDQSEVRAASALDAAQAVSGDRSLRTAGSRQDLRARVWPTPFGSQPDLAFFSEPTP